MISPEQQSFEPIELGALLARVAALQKERWRFVAISGARSASSFELLYSFDLDYRLLSLRLSLPLDQPRIPSISSIYWSAMLYENELHDLFNLQIDGMAVDFKGNLYKMAVKYPLGSSTPPEEPSTSTATTPPESQPPAASTTTATGKS